MAARHPGQRTCAGISYSCFVIMFTVIIHCANARTQIQIHESSEAHYNEVCLDGKNEERLLPVRSIQLVSSYKNRQFELIVGVLVNPTKLAFLHSCGVSHNLA